MNLGDEGPEVADERGREVRFLERAGDDIVSKAGKGRFPEVVLLHEQIEELGGDDGHSRHGDLDIGAERGRQPGLEDIPHQGQAVSLTAQGTSADGREFFLAGEEMTVERDDGRRLQQYQIQPRSWQAWTTRETAMAKAACRNERLFFLANSRTALKADVNLTSSFPSTSSFSQ